MPDRPLITSEDLTTLAPEWADLYARVPGASPFLHPEWHRVWLRHFGAGASPVFLSVRLDETLVGVAAFDMDRDLARELGDHNVRDYAGPLVLPGHEAAVAEGVLEWLREDLTPALTLWGVPADSASATAFADAAAPGGWSYEQIPEAVCPGVNLPGDFEAFVAALDKHDRHELRRKLRNFAAAGANKFTGISDPEEIRAAMPQLFHLMRISRADKAEFLTPAMESFFVDVATSFAELGFVRLGKVTLDSQAVAMTLSFEDETTTYLYNSGYDPAFSQFAVGLVSKAYAIRDAIERGKSRFDFLRGDEDYKRRLGGIDREVVTVRLQS